jgi:hypothetical protein
MLKTIKKLSTIFLTATIIFLGNYTSSALGVDKGVGLDLNGNENLLPSEVIKELPSRIEKEWKKARSATLVFIVGSVRREGSWGLGTIVPQSSGQISLETDDADDLQAEGAESFAFAFYNNNWHTSLESSLDLSEVLKNIPDKELSPSVKKSLLTSTSTQLTGIQFSQKYFGYKLPFASNVPITLFRPAYYWHHPDVTGKAIDFAPNNDAFVMASAPGYISNVCINSNGRQAWIWISTADPNNPGQFLSNEQLLYLHFDKGTLPSNIKQGNTVLSGQILGKVIQNGDESQLACSMWSTARHVHILFPFKPFNIDGYGLTSYSNGNLEIIDRNGSELSFNQSTQFFSSQGLDESPWIIHGYVEVDNTTAIQGDLIVKNDGYLLIKAGANLGFNFLTHKIYVESGGKLTIENQASIH